MAKVIVPVIKLVYPSQYAFSLDVSEIFEDEEGGQQEDQFTYTTRYTVTDEAQRERIKDRLRATLEAEEAKALIDLLDKTEWDLSFYVDTF